MRDWMLDKKNEVRKRADNISEQNEASGKGMGQN